MSGFFFAILNHLWQSTVFLVAICAAMPLFRRCRAAVRYRLWLVASVKFLVPFSLLFTLGSRIDWPTPTSTPATSLALVVRNGGQTFAEPLNFVLQSPARFEGQGNSNFMPLVFLIWLGGTVIVTWLYLSRWSRVWRMKRQALPLSTVSSSCRLPVLTTSENIEPGVFGIREPVLLMPKTVSEVLTPVQLDSVIAHELAHVQRRDNLCSVVPCVVQAIFWFHPVTWWLGDKLIHERESACDEAVLRQGFDPVEYAEAILKVCRTYLEAPACVAGVGGGKMKSRIEGILNFKEKRNLPPAVRAVMGLVLITSLAIPVLLGAVKEPPVLKAPVIPAIPSEAAKSAAPVYARPAVQSPADSSKWPEEVSFIISRQEREAFQSRMKEDERQEFIRNFWLVRDPTPGTPVNEFREEYELRVVYARDHFTSGKPGDQTDRGRMYILNGQPDEIESHPAGGIYTRPGDGEFKTFPFETWRYRHIDGKGDNLIYEFVDFGNGEYVLQFDPSAKEK